MKYIERSNSCISERNVALQEKNLSNDYEQKVREKFNFTSTCFSCFLGLFVHSEFEKICIRIK